MKDPLIRANFFFKMRLPQIYGFANGPQVAALLTLEKEKLMKLEVLKC